MCKERFRSEFRYSNDNNNKTFKLFADIFKTTFDKIA